MLGTLTQGAYLIRQDGHHEVQSRIVVLAIGHEFNRHKLTRRHESANVLLGTIRRAVINILIGVNGLRILISHLLFLTVNAVIHRHVVAWHVIFVQCLGRDSTGQAHEAIFRSLQREFTTVVSTVWAIVTAIVIYLEENRIRSEFHDLRLTISRNLHIPHGIENLVVCGH